MQNLKGLIFDMDGVVVDNHAYHFQAWMDFSKKYQFELNAQIYRDQFNGKTNRDLFQMLFKGISEIEIEKRIKEKEELYQKIYAQEMKAHKGLIDFLEYLKGHKYKVALGTSAPPMNVDFTLDNLFLRGYFDAIVDGTMVNYGKPHPQVYQMCAAKLGLDPSHCVVFEDSLAGLEAAQRAGCAAVGVATSHSAKELSVKTDKIIFDFTEARKLLHL